MKTKLLVLLMCLSFSLMSFGQNEEDIHNSEDSTTDGRISLRLAGNGNFMTILLGFIPEGTVNFDDGFDSYFINDGSVIEFYSFLNTTRLSIQALPELTNTDIQVPLGYEITSDGTYTISIDAEFLDPTFDIILEDTYQGTFTDLRQTPYTFADVVGETNDRFFLKFDRRSALNVEDRIQDKNDLQAYFTHDMLHIHTKQGLIKTVALYNISGKRVFMSNFQNTIQTTNLANGVYVLRCTNSSGATIIKKIVK
ncbi:T9SS type A sorting domain-containing protein [Kordia jejudonensis]|uniref:T9SS type A sorting domain-containing protein n=1 Tax=Kordia jejudonensis TaxID=1348245 RepID=UPI0009E59B1D|nr:T9SS type A sorting domain-containing protein [Kordia jejudonensis]